MDETPHQKLEAHIRAERWRRLRTALPGVALFALVFGTVAIVALRVDVGLGQSFHRADVISVTDRSDGAGTVFEVLTRYSGQQRIFETSDFALVETLGAGACIKEWLGAPIKNAPTPTYYALVEQRFCKDAPLGGET